MACSVSFEPESIDDLDQISQAARVRILKKIQWLSVNFEKISALPLTGQWLSGAEKSGNPHYVVVLT